jgi:uncharacterized protein
MVLCVALSGRKRPPGPKPGAQLEPLSALPALRGQVDAQVDLVTRYLLGRGGMPQDDRIAAQWYERAHAGGDEVAPLKVEQLATMLRQLRLD